MHSSFGCAGSMMSSDPASWLAPSGIDDNIGSQSVDAFLPLKEDHLNSAQYHQSVTEVPSLVDLSFQKSTVTELCFPSAPDPSDHPWLLEERLEENWGHGQSSYQISSSSAEVSTDPLPLWAHHQRITGPAGYHPSASSAALDAAERFDESEWRSASVTDDHDESGMIYLNPGSVGHPELCPRPCLYVSAGRCENGEQCNFCHYAHSKRPSHLDKRNRALLKELPVSESLFLLIPLLEVKTESLGLGPHAMQHLHGLCVPLQQKRCRALGTLKTAMAGMSLRCLLMALHRVAVAQEDSSACEALGASLEDLRFQVYTRHGIDPSHLGPMSMQDDNQQLQAGLTVAL
ncbi:unnamed protein product [Polarella glacialis]|uniref:C3H1-type domain-containing protein n=2 Tax=Polarella glacialis TaxID=89957 RepID=A0A813KNU2_POLGL|nr:unnamed protein product [Polarella glacialis]